MSHVAYTLLITVMVSSFAGSQAGAGQPAQPAAHPATLGVTSMEQRKAIGSAAIRTLRYVTRARSAIHGKDLKTAEQDLERARELLDLVRAARPAASIKEHIWVARQHMEYETAAEVRDDLMLIDAELVNLAGTTPTLEAHRHLQAAQSLLLADDVPAARTELDRLEAALVFTELDLPLAAAEEQIITAQALLTEGKTDAADKTLAAAEESIQFLAVLGSTPLARARDDLHSAADNYLEKHYAAARADLARAGSWLRLASERSAEKGKQGAQQLADEIEALGKRIEQETGNRAHTLGGFIHRSLALIEHEAESMWLRYRQQQAINKTLRGLIDAKLHLFYAGHELESDHDDALMRAREELRRADRYLGEALQEAQPEIRERITAVRVEIAAMEAGLDGDREDAKARYEETMADLRRLIRDN
ncbi:MAG: YfdX family protein [Thiogranum sp.]